MTRLTIGQLGLAPEMAILAVLESAADTTVLVLTAFYPELQDFHDPSDYSQTTLAARAVIDHARATRGAIMRYRKTALRLLHQSDHTLPF
jgi:hypothetical protein